MIHIIYVMHFTPFMVSEAIKEVIKNKISDKSIYKKIKRNKNCLNFNGTYKKN